MSECQKCGSSYNIGDTECPKCGIIFAKIKELQAKTELKNESVLMPCKVCEKEISRNAKACPHCGEPLANAPEQTNVAVKQAAAPKFKPSFITIVGGGFLGICLLIAIFGGMFGMKKSGATAPSNDLHNMAYTQCQHFVSQELKAPASADFPFFDTQHYKAPNDVYIIHSYVDAQNSFGAKIRSKWRCKVQYAGGEYEGPASWKLLEVRIY